MISDLDIYRSAAVLIRQHGDKASYEATRLIDKMLEKSDIEGQAIWKRVLAAVEELQWTEAQGDTQRH